MRIRRNAVLDLASTFGAVALFGAWAFQQTLVSQAAEALQTIHSAEAGFETYQSNNGLFNALDAAVPSATSEIRRFQTINYEFALRHLEMPLGPEERVQLPAARPFDGNWDADVAMRQTQERIEAIQSALGRRKQKITAQNVWVNRIFPAMYAAGSLLILSTSTCKMLLPSKE